MKKVVLWKDGRKIAFDISSEIVDTHAPNSKRVSLRKQNKAIILFLSKSKCLPITILKE